MPTPEIIPSSLERTPLPADISMDELMKVLVLGNVPVRRYGMGQAKTVVHLLNEIHEGESVVSVDARRKVYRELQVLSTDVIYQSAEGTVYVLKEDRQEFKDGRVKRRKMDLSIGYRERTFYSDMYPGIESSYKFHRYVTEIPASEYNPEGYVEHQDDKTNYFVWKVLKTPSKE